MTSDEILQQMYDNTVLGKVPEVRALTDAAQGWVDDLALVTTDERLRALLDEQGAVLVGYRELRTAMRAG